MVRDLTSQERQKGSRLASQGAHSVLSLKGDHGERTRENNQRHHYRIESDSPGRVVEQQAHQRNHAKLSPTLNANRSIVSSSRPFGNSASTVTYPGMKSTKTDPSTHRRTTNGISGGTA